LFNGLSILPGKWQVNFFWITWILIGLFYSWPTRGKIIQESISSNMSEFRYLDVFEKTILSTTLILFFISISFIPPLQTAEGLKIFYSTGQSISPLFWDFVRMTLIPFKNHSHLSTYAYFSFMHYLSLGMYLLLIYGVSRHFFSRRVSLMSALLCISSWMFYKNMLNYPASLASAVPTILFFWVFLWMKKNSSYRATLFVSLTCFYTSLFFPLLGIFQLLCALIILLLRKNTQWIFFQHIKYAATGVVLLFLNILYWMPVNFSNSQANVHILDFFRDLMRDKGIHIIFIISFVLMIYSVFAHKFSELKKILILEFKTLITLVSLILYGLITFILSYYSHFSTGVLFTNTYWIIPIITMLTLDQIFLHLNKLRSKRNFIISIYYLIIMLDSHTEGRFKALLEVFKRQIE